MLLTLFNARRLEEGVNNSDTTRVCTLKDIPILTYHGTVDNEISIHETERIAESLKKCNGNIIFHRIAGEGHGTNTFMKLSPRFMSGC